ERYLNAFKASTAGAVLLREEHADEPKGPTTRIVVAEPHKAIHRVAERLYPQEEHTPGVHPTAVLGVGVTLGPEASIGPYAVLGRRVRIGARAVIGAGCVIGDDVTLGEDGVLDPHVTVYSGCTLGARVLLKSGAIVGGPGFGYTEGDQGHSRLLHVGSVILEDDVEIGSHTCVDRGSLGDTVVGRGTKVDNLVQIAHNVRIGPRCLIAGQAGFAGSGRTGQGVLIGGGAMIGGHITVGDGARIGGGSGVTGDVPPGAAWSGLPARPHREALRTAASLQRLAVVAARLEKLVEKDGKG
ncbi:MAG: UDP-3-O-(3-hydroxymyristoyl)glucosamine N-acyltransferase, partial [Gemmatimonadetes bacterium]|nr:UDP-3-O-(3-hydroxymyristoyl)glucosamine N-acyltransferase [Gemmatimonadota bacterium]